MTRTTLLNTQPTLFHGTASQDKFANIIMEREIMGWVEEQIEQQQMGPTGGNGGEAESYFEMRARQKWEVLLAGFQRDLQEFARGGEVADLQKFSEGQCRITNPAAHISVRLTAEFSDHVFRYNYEQNEKNTPVPEDGILTLRLSGNLMNIYSADQQLTLEQARKLILEPVFFPTKPSAGEIKAA